jgi:hypothetical protein
VEARSVILFHSHNYAIWASRVLKDGGIEHKIMPVPRKLSSSCGFCIKVSSSLLPNIIAQLNQAGVEYDRTEQL